MLLLLTVTISGATYAGHPCLSVTVMLFGSSKTTRSSGSTIRTFLLKCKKSKLDQPKQSNQSSLSNLYLPSFTSLFSMPSACANAVHIMICRKLFCAKSCKPCKIVSNQRETASNLIHASLLFHISQKIKSCVVWLNKVIPPICVLHNL